jgi:hypothetical protein
MLLVGRSRKLYHASMTWMLAMVSEMRIFLEWEKRREEG